MMQRYFNLPNFLVGLMTEPEATGLPKGQRRYIGIATDFMLFIRMPGHTVIPVAI